MNFPIFIAKRYLFSKKKHNAINIISGISVCGVAFATMALVCTLSVFNGFRDLIANFFTAFDPELKITVVEGKVFNPNEAVFKKVKNLPSIAVFSESLEDNAVVQYKGRQCVVTIKGVQDNFQQLTQIDSILYGKGMFMLHADELNYGVLGVQLISSLDCGLRFVDPIEVYAPVRGEDINLANPMASFKVDYLYSPGVAFAVNQKKYDASYILTSLDFARHLFDYDKDVSSIELKLKDNENVDKVQKQIQSIVGSHYIVQNRYEQQQDVFHIMEIEKLISYLFLVFILMIACFNVIGSLSMLILDKKKDVVTLRNMGASNKLIYRVFLFEGRMILFLGAIIGILLGLLLCFLQQRYGLVPLGDSAGTFVVDSYPVSIHVSDLVIIFISVVIIGLLSVWYPVRYLSKKLLKFK